MVDYDPANQNTVAPGKLPVLGGKPTIAELKAAIIASGVAAKYTNMTAAKSIATKNDLIYICRVEGIAVAGLPGV